jgi:Uma2 family endonuclease
MVRALPADGLRYETVHGELLVSRAPAAPHRRVASRLAYGLARYLGGKGLGRALAAPAGLAPGPDTLVQPDVFVAPAPGLRGRTAPLLVAEVATAATLRADRFTKRRLYQELGVPVYWVVDPEAGVVEVWSPDALLPLVEHARLRWAPSPLHPPLTLPLSELLDQG